MPAFRRLERLLPERGEQREGLDIHKMILSIRKNL
jgi:hypothetical protein